MIRSCFNRVSDDYGLPAKAETTESVNKSEDTVKKSLATDVPRSVITWKKDGTIYQLMTADERTSFKNRVDELESVIQNVKICKLWAKSYFSWKYFLLPLFAAGYFFYRERVWKKQEEKLVKNLTQGGALSEKIRVMEAIYNMSTEKISYIGQPDRSETMVRAIKYNLENHVRTLKEFYDAQNQKKLEERVFLYEYLHQSNAAFATECATEHVIKTYKSVNENVTNTYPGEEIRDVYPKNKVFCTIYDEKNNRAEGVADFSVIRLRGEVKKRLAYLHARTVLDLGSKKIKIEMYKKKPDQNDENACPAFYLAIPLIKKSATKEIYRRNIPR
ncbi:MAG: hypothetical protein AAGF04_03660 [Chlamydiota bacterium]